MFPEMKTTLNELSRCQILCTAFSEFSLGTGDTLHLKNYFLFGLLAALYCLFVLYLVGFSVLGRVSVVVRDSKKQLFIFEENISFPDT